MSIELCGLFICWQLRLQPQEIPLEKGDPMEVARLLWRFNEPLTAKDVQALLQRSTYDPAGEDEFDRMLERLAWNPEATFVNDTNAGLIVWDERLRQALLTLSANAALGETVILPPLELDERARSIAAALLWLHRMELPFHPGTSLPR